VLVCSRPRAAFSNTPKLLISSVDCGAEFLISRTCIDLPFPTLQRTSLTRDAVHWHAAVRHVNHPHCAVRATKSTGTHPPPSTSPSLIRAEIKNVRPSLTAVSSSTPVQSLRLCPQMQAPPPLTPPAAHSQLRWRTHCLTVPPSIDESQPSLQPTSSIPRPKKLARVPRRRRHKPQNPNSIGGPTTPVATSHRPHPWLRHR
jgi:hypothetical protein